MWSGVSCGRHRPQIAAQEKGGNSRRTDNWEHRKTTLLLAAACRGMPAAAAACRHAFRIHSFPTEPSSGMHLRDIM